MKFGALWNQQEVAILLKSSTVFEAQVNLKAAGYNRSPEGIRRKCKRLNVVHKEQVPLHQYFGTFPDLEPEEDDYPQVIGNSPIWHNGSLPLGKNSLTRFVMLNDVHVPHNIPLENIWKFVKDYKPHYLLLVGDIINNDPFSHWDRKSPLRFKSMPNPKEHYEQCNKLFFDPMREAVGDDCRVVYWIGNHEYWSNRAIEEMPEGRGYWEVENNIRNVDLWVPNKEIANLGKLHFVHGDVIRGGRHHSAKMLNYFRRNIRYGHYHNLEEYSYTSPVDVGDRHTARCCGTLEKPNPRFMENRPHDWMACVTYGVVQPDGNFHDHSAVITNGSFMAKFVTKSFDFRDVLLVPKKCIVNSRKDISLSTIISHNEHSNILLGMPLISANMDTITGQEMACVMSKWSGVGFLHRYQDYNKVLDIITYMKTHNFHPIIPSIGVSEDNYWSEIAFLYLSSGADGICIDIAHGHSQNMIKQLKELTTKYPKEHFIAGNIATEQAAIDLIDAGATGLKVGIGPGAVCTTRFETGAGVPQLTAIMDVAKIAKQRNIPIIADGGIKSAGDVVKALAAGASAVMCGSLFAGCDETPSTDGTYRGMASFDAKKDFNLSTNHVEGKTILVQDKGPVDNIIKHLCDGIKSGISYCGARNINELWTNAEFTITK